MYPAYDAIAKDLELGFAKWRVYMALQPPVLGFENPVLMKADALAHAVHMNRNTVNAALDWLIAAGYVVDHGRDARKTRQLTLAWTKAERVPSTLGALLVAGATAGGALRRLPQIVATETGVPGRDRRGR